MFVQLPLIVLLVALLAPSPCYGQGYCTRAAGIFNTTDSGAACFGSLQYSVINCCFRCSTADPAITACGSLYNYNITSCDANETILAKAKLDCSNGYNGTFSCYCNTGIYTSQLDYTSNLTASPTYAPTVNTAAPTNAASSSFSSIGIATLVFIVLWYIVV